MADDEKAAELSRKWCRLCEEWKAAIVLTAETGGTELVESSRELTYCRSAERSSSWGNLRLASVSVRTRLGRPIPSPFYSMELRGHPWPFC
jgi:hypothetical protein